MGAVRSFSTRSRKERGVTVPRLDRLIRSLVVAIAKGAKDGALLLARGGGRRAGS